MIIKVTRGSDFDRLRDYLLRLGSYSKLGEAWVIAVEGAYDERTVAAQLAFNAALAPERTRPVVHLMARAEDQRPFTDEQCLELAKQMMRAARLEDRPYMAVKHDDGHLHILTGEMNEEGRPPARWLWHVTEKREVSAATAKNLPRGRVRSRAWDSNLSWRLTDLAREVEIDWGLRRLATPRQQTPDEPTIDRWQRERLERNAHVPLQDRYGHVVRTALELPSWDERTAALAEHGLAIRAHLSGERLRGLQIHNLADSRDFVKVSAFGAGGMLALDVSAGQRFTDWEAIQRGVMINLVKAQPTFDPEMARMRALFRVEQKEWHRSSGRRKAAFRQHKQAKAMINADLARFDGTMSPFMSPAGRRVARQELRSGMQVRAKAELDYALTIAGPQRPRPVFIDFVKQRAGTGDAGAARVLADLLGKVSETRRLDFEQKVASLKSAAKHLRLRAVSLRETLSRGTVDLRAAGTRLRRTAGEQVDEITVQMSAAVFALKLRSARVAAKLADALDKAGYRIRMRHDGGVRIDRWQPTNTEQMLVQNAAHRLIFEKKAQDQSAEVEQLCAEITDPRVIRTEGGQLVLNVHALTGAAAVHCRWASQPEMIDRMSIIKRNAARKAAAEERVEADVRSAKARAEADKWQVAYLTNLALITRIEHDLLSIRRSRANAAPAPDIQLNVQGGPIDEVRSKLPGGDHENGVSPTSLLPQKRQRPPLRLADLLTATTPATGQSSGAQTFFKVWQDELRHLSANQPLDMALLRSIEVRAAQITLQSGISQDATTRTIAERSPIGSDASTILNDAIRDPVTRRAVKDADEKADRDLTISNLYVRQPTTAVGERFVDLWKEIFAERPLDTALPRAERDRSVDYEVATVMLGEGTGLSDVQRAIHSLSPSTARISPPHLARYIDKLCHDLADRLPPGDERARFVSLVQREASARHLSVDDHHGDAAQSLPENLPSSPCRFAESGFEPDIDGRILIDGVEIQTAVPTQSPGGRERKDDLPEDVDRKNLDRSIAATRARDQGRNR